MNVNYSETLSQAFVAGPDELKKLVELLQKRIGEVSISADCIDKIERKFNTVKDLIDYENPKPKRIRRIYLTAQSDDYSKSFTIVFRDSFYREAGISIDITGREDVVSRLKEEVLDVVTGMRPWYNFMFDSKVGTIITTVFGMILGASLVFGSEIKDISFITYLRDVGPIYLMVAVLFLCLTSLFCQLREHLFPQIVFTIGQGQSRFKLLEKVRWGVVIAFSVSFAAGLLLLIFK